MNHLTRVELFEHTGRGLPEMLDIRKSADGAGGAGAPPSVRADAGGEPGT